MNPQRVLVLSFVIACGLIAWSDISDYNEFPRPSRLLSAGLTWAILGIVAAVGAPQVAGAIGIGLNVGQVYRLKWAGGKSGIAPEGVETVKKNPFS